MRSCLVILIPFFFFGHKKLYSCAPYITTLLHLVRKTISMKDKTCYFWYHINEMVSLTDCNKKQKHIIHTKSNCVVPFHFYQNKIKKKEYKKIKKENKKMVHLKIPRAFEKQRHRMYYENHYI